MFRRGLFGRIVSDEGYWIKFHDRSNILYQDKRTRVFVSAETLAAPRSWVLYASDMRLNSPKGDRLTDSTLRSAITRRIVEAAKSSGITVEVA